MKKAFLGGLAVLFLSGIIFSASVFGADIELAKKSTLETIIKRGQLLVGLEAGYQPFEMQDEKGNIVGFDVDMAYEMGKAIFGEGGEKKVKLVNTAWEGIIPALMTEKFDIIMSGMTV